MWLYIVFAIIVFVFYVLNSFKYDYDYWKKKEVPTASGCEWFYGHYKPIMLVKKHFNDFFDIMYRELPDAPMIGYYVMNAPALLVRDMDIIKTILISEYSSFNFSGLVIDKSVDPVVAVHPFSLEGDQWKTARTQVAPALSPTKLRLYFPQILSVGDEMVKYLNKNCGGSELETQKLSRMYATDVIAKALFGVQNNTFENKDSLVANLTRYVHFECSVLHNFKLLFKDLPFVSRFLPARLVSLKLKSALVAMTRRLIKERMAIGENRNDLIQLLLKIKENDTQGVVTDETLSGQMLIIILDLCESTSSALSSLIYLLSTHPEIQEKLRKEIKGIKSKNNGEFTIKDVNNAKYLNMVYSESLRLFGLILSRQCTKDCYVPMPGSKPFKITKGTLIVIPTPSIHNDPKYYSDPEKFDPERFTDEEVAKRPRFSYMPFGEGPKMCSGTRIVELHIKAAIIKILDNFKLTPSLKTKYPFEIDPRFTFTIRFKNDIWVNFKPIDE